MRKFQLDSAAGIVEDAAVQPSNLSDSAAEWLKQLPLHYQRAPSDGDAGNGET